MDKQAGPVAKILLERGKISPRPPLHKPGLTINPGWQANPGQPVYK